MSNKLWEVEYEWPRNGRWINSDETLQILAVNIKAAISRAESFLRRNADSRTRITNCSSRGTIDAGLPRLKGA